jgi:hypothetical protein
MSPLPDEVKDLSESLWDKVKHPVLGPFASAWLLWNWQILFLFIHGLEKPTETIQEIQNNYLGCGRLGHLFWGPAISTLVFIVIGAYLRSAFISWNKLVEVQRNKIDAHIEEKDVVQKILLTKAENEIKDLKNTVTFIQNRISELTGEVNEAIQAFTGITDGSGMVVDENGTGYQIKDLYRSNRALMKQNGEFQKRIKFLEEQLSTEKMRNKTAK